MAEVKQGESVKVTAEGFDKDGNLISSVVYNWYGYSNEEHNKTQLEMAQRMVDMVKGWAEEKSER